MKLTPKQESFCMAYVETGNASEAYRVAYPRSRNWKAEAVHVRASEVMATHKVMVRIDELQARHRKRHDITIDKLTEDAYKAIEEAKANGQAGAYVAALTLIAKMHGLLTEKRELSSPGGGPVVLNIEHIGVSGISSD